MVENSFSLKYIAAMGNTAPTVDILDVSGQPGLEFLVRSVIATISRHRIDLSTEKAAQAQIETIFTGAGLPFEREVSLSKEDRPDFFMKTVGLAIEVKMKGAQKMAIYRQLQRYAAHDEVHGLLLVSNLAMGLPMEIGGKPAWYASLGRAWI